MWVAAGELDLPRPAIGEIALDDECSGVGARIQQKWWMGTEKLAAAAGIQILTTPTSHFFSLIAFHNFGGEIGKSVIRKPVAA